MYRYRKAKSTKSKKRTYSSRSYSGARSSVALTRSVIGQSRAGTKRVTVSIPKTFDGNFTWAANSFTSNVLRVRASSYPTDASTLPYMDTYKSFANLFDECRIVGCKCKLIFGDGFTSTGAAPFLTFLTCLDRKTAHQITGIQNIMTPAEIAGSSSCVKTDFTVQQRMCAYRSFYAQSWLEKQTFWESRISANNSTGFWIPGLENDASAFNPTMFMVCNAGVAPSADTNLRFRIQLEWILEFRNPKLSLPSESSKTATRAAFGADDLLAFDPLTDKTEEEKEETDPGTS